LVLLETVNGYAHVLNPHLTLRGETMDDEMSQSEAMAKIWDLIRDVKVAMLTTSGPQGELRSRPMASQESGFDGDLWFLSRQQSGKVDEIERGSSVSLTYVNNDRHAYVALSGMAELSKSREKINELWKPVDAAWFPQGKDDPDMIAIKVTIEEAKYWEAPGNALVRTYALLKAIATQGKSKAGEHEKIAL
jgi:general stress protein 26